MTNPTSPNPLYHDPDGSRNHSRRSSTRKSFASGSGSLFDSPRTPCPRDGDAFSYDPAHLPAWSVPENLSVRLPDRLKAALTAVERSGAAVLTAFERLEKHVSSHADSPTVESLNDRDLLHLDLLPSPKLYIPTAVSSTSSSDLASPISLDSSTLESPFISSSQQSINSVSPICLTPSDSYVLEKRNRPRERSFTTPTDPSDSYYRAEVSHLRTEALPRLRHASFKVNTEWYEAKRLGDFSEDEINNFEAWWSDKRNTISHLNEQGTRLSLFVGLTSSGMGWTAP